MQSVSSVPGPRWGAPLKIAYVHPTFFDVVTPLAAGCVRVI